MGKSPLWKYFDNVTFNGVKYARCKDSNCEANSNSALYISIRADKSTCGLWRHLRSHHADIAELEETLKEDKKLQAEKEKSETADVISKFVFKPDSQLKLADCVKLTGPPYKKVHPIQKQFRINMKNLIVNDALPFKLAESKWFRKLVNDLDPRITVNSRKTYSSSIKKEGKIVKRRAQKHVKESVCSGYASSADIWTSRSQDDYLGINAQFIDSSWRWQKIVLACKPFPVQHSGDNIKKLLTHESSQLDIPESTIKVNVTDTASDMLKGRNVAGFSSISCCIHKLQLVGKDAEQTEGAEEVDEAVKAARALVNHAKHCGPFLRTMRKYCPKNNHTFTKLTKSVKTRWNSNYDMVNRLIKHRSCIQSMENDDAVPNMPIIENSQWRILKTIQRYIGSY